MKIKYIFFYEVSLPTNLILKVKIKKKTKSIKPIYNTVEKKNYKAWFLKQFNIE